MKNGRFEQCSVRRAAARMATTGASIDRAETERSIPCGQEARPPKPIAFPRPFSGENSDQKRRQALCFVS